MENISADPDITLRDNTVNLIDNPAKTAEDPKAFWQTQSALMEQRLADPALREAAFDELKEETAHLPVYYQKSLEALLEDASKTNSRESR
jgi:hypothetical protein